MKKFSYLILFFSNLFSYSNQDESIYKNIEKVYLKSFDLSKNDDQEQAVLGMALPRPSDFILKKIIFEVLSKYSKTISGTVIDESLWKDLELFYGSGKDSSVNLFSKIDRTETNAGKIVLARILATPIVNIAELTKRQNAIKELVDKPGLLLRCKQLLSELKQSEEQLLAFWNEDQFINKTLFQKLYFKKLKFLNQSPIALEVKRRLGIVSPFWGTYEKMVLFSAMRHFVGNWIKYEYITKQQERKFRILNNLNPNAFFNMSQAYRNAKYYGGEISGVAELLIGSIAGIDIKNLPEDKNAVREIYLENLCSAENFIKNNPSKEQFFEKELKDFSQDVTSLDEFKWIVNKLKNGGDSLAGIIDSESSDYDVKLQQGVSIGLAVLCGCLLVFEIQNIIPKIKDELERISLTNYLQKRLSCIGSFFKVLGSLNLLVLASNDLRGGLLLHNQIVPLFGKFSKCSEKLRKLISIVSSNTFNNGSSYFSYTGRSLAAYQLMFDIQNDMGPVLEALGEIDAYVSIAKLYKEFENKCVKYCFASYKEEEHPYFNLKEFWNPFVNCKVVVPNSLELGGDKQASNIVLTGPNAGGKSTILKGITINLLFAQTLGIAPASEVTITPFSKINSYLNITDDLTAGNSLFRAEVLRAQSLIRTVKALKDKQFSFSIMDEMFSGTSPKEGEAASYAVTKYLGECNNSMSVIATHFPMLTTLAEDTNGVFKNCKVAVSKNIDGGLVYPYKLENGLSDQHIAFEILVNEGVLDYSVLGMAHNLLRKRFPALYSEAR